MDDTQLKWLRWALGVLLAVAALAAYFFMQQVNSLIQTSAAVQVPEVVATAINIGTVALLTAGFLWVFNVFGIDIRGMAPVIGLALSTWIVAQVQSIVNTVPAQFDPYINALFYLLTLILAPAGLLYIFGHKKESPKERLI